MKVALVGCSKSKLARPAPAAELYTSPAFRMARSIALRYDDWRVLSAKHGVLRPGQIVRPYDLSLAIMSRMERAAWAQVVRASLCDEFSHNTTFIVLAGKLYAEAVIGLPHEAPLSAASSMGSYLSLLRRLSCSL